MICPTSRCNFFSQKMPLLYRTNPFTKKKKSVLLLKQSRYIIWECFYIRDGSRLRRYHIDFLTYLSKFQESVVKFVGPWNTSGLRWPPTWALVKFPGETDFPLDPRWKLYSRHLKLKQALRGKMSSKRTQEIVTYHLTWLFLFQTRQQNCGVRRSTDRRFLVNNIWPGRDSSGTEKSSTSI